MNSLGSISRSSKQSFSIKNLLKLEDSFNFSCKSCGKCCRNRIDINLTGYNIYRIAKYLGKSNDDIIVRYGTLFISQLLLSSVALKMQAGTCPFLRNKKCAIEAAKPGVCRCYPLGRMFLPGEQTANFIRVETGCNHAPHEIKIRDWIGEFSSEEAEQIGSLWSNTLSRISYTLQKSSSYAALPENAKQEVLKIIFTTLFVDYSTEEEFYPQLEENISNLRTELHSLYSIDIISIEDLKKDFSSSLADDKTSLTISGGVMG